VKLIFSQTALGFLFLWSKHKGGVHPARWATGCGDAASHHPAHRPSRNHYLVRRVGRVRGLQRYDDFTIV